jgi:general secretion pathway protein A
VPSMQATFCEIISPGVLKQRHREAMYLNYFNLGESPFQISTDPKFLWVGKQQEEVLSAFDRSLVDNQGLFVLTGDIGTGKTTLVHAFIKSLGAKTFRAVLSYPKIGKLEFFNFLADCFHFSARFTKEAEFFKYFVSFLRISCKFSYRVVLIIDEADRIPDEILHQILYFTHFEMLEETKMLAHWVRTYRRPINIYLVGRDDLGDVLKHKKFTILRHKISYQWQIRPLTAEETVHYIAHRLKVAGATGEIFTKGAVLRVFSLSGGYPRVINILCGNALVCSFLKRRKRVDARIVEQCAENLGYRLKASRA